MSSSIPPDAFAARRTGLEADYFHKQDADMVGKLKQVFDRKMGREELRKATGITSDQVLDRLLAVNARGEMLLAFRLYPLVDIAWADGSVDKREVKAVIEAATKLGVPREVRPWPPLKSGSNAALPKMADSPGTCTPRS